MTGPSLRHFAHGNHGLRGKGYVAYLTYLAAQRIAARGETPFLHAFADNRTAIRVYEAIGFKLRRQMTVAMLRKANAHSVAPAASLG